MYHHIFQYFQWNPHQCKLLVALSKHNKTNQGYQIHLNTGNLDEETSSKHMDVEFTDIPPKPFHKLNPILQGIP